MNKKVKETKKIEGTIYNGRILKRIKMKYYDIVHEEVDNTQYGGKGSMVMKYAVSKEGKYIGTTITAYRLVKKYGIEQFELAAPTNNVVSIGYNLKKRKWYGWSHRAIYGFAIGSKVKKGNCGYVPATLEEHVEDIKQFWETDNVKIKGRNIVCFPEGSALGINTSIKKLPMGKGEWQAKSLADAKQMAIDFANGVS